VAAGDLVPGDLRIIEASGLRVDNSPLTGARARACGALAHVCWGRHAGRDGAGALGRKARDHPPALNRPALTPAHFRLPGESEALELGVTWPGVTAPESACDEEEPIVKQHVKGTPAAVEAPNLAFFSTTVVGGHGTGIVIGTGSNTVMGQIASGWRQAGWLLALGLGSGRLYCP
jgi:magnesium-transporting ATPase (P-type)